MAFGPSKTHLPNRRGFDTFYGNLSGAVGYWDHVHAGHYDWQRNGKTRREDGYVTHLQASEALRVVRGRDKKNHCSCSYRYLRRTCLMKPRPKPLTPMLILLTKNGEPMPLW